ncbi:YceI family protein [Flavobacterium saccharophilum]|uniref:YceI-like domain-containing protein n=1 Tax=Flavobacterium saccharophilum TaxID=29534 RepID=A0A1M7DAZ7_9FLAO|nr:YceI family protein [Flavobacterium saccharophilum]SHL76630.1 YceI-like domain-containing protein [Flavobacterium saccharophilum]
MKKLIVLLLLFVGTVNVSAQKYMTKTGSLKFEASVDSFEEIAAENKNTSAILESATGEIAVLTLVKGFRFKIALMEEHFNENYIESDKFPKATFKGKVEDFDVAKLSSASGMFKISGDLTLHGKTKKVTTNAKISKSGDKITITGNFEAKPEDFDIEIPKLVSKKVADKVKITFNLLLTK